MTELKQSIDKTCKKPYAFAVEFKEAKPRKYKKDKKVTDLSLYDDLEKRKKELKIVRFCAKHTGLLGGEFGPVTTLINIYRYYKLSKKKNKKHMIKYENVINFYINAILKKHEGSESSPYCKIKNACNGSTTKPATNTAANKPVTNTTTNSQEKSKNGEKKIVESLKTIFPGDELKTSDKTKIDSEKFKEAIQSLDSKNNK